MTTCHYCSLPANDVFNGICVSCLGPREKWQPALTLLQDDIPRLKKQIAKDWKHRAGLKDCLADYARHLEAFKLASACKSKGKAGARLRAMRKRRGMTQEQLADFLGVTRSAIARVENGYDDCPEQWLLKAEC